MAWEAQFGDFVNGAQIIIDNFLAAAENKWGQHAGLIMLLPHGYEGQGPEHSSARFERFLALCARGNMRVAIPSTPAQYFHLLRSQALLPPKRPLIVVTPKSLLRAPASRSPIEARGGSFADVLDDPEVGCRRRSPRRPVQRKGGPRGPATTTASWRRGRSGAGDGRGEGRAALPVAARRAPPFRPLRPGRRGGLAPRRAREHGGLVVRPRPPARACRHVSGSSREPSESASPAIGRLPALTPSWSRPIWVADAPDGD